MLLTLSIAFAAVISVLIIWVCYTLDYDVKWFNWLAALVVGVLVGVINYFAFAPKMINQYIAWLAFIVMILLLFGLMLWWLRDGDECWWSRRGTNEPGLEMELFIVLAVLFFFPTMRLSRILIASEFWTPVLTTIPLVLLVLVVGVFIWRYFQLRYKNPKEYSKKAQNLGEFREKNKNRATWTMVVVVVAILFIASRGIDWKVSNENTAAAANTPTEPETADEVELDQFYQAWTSNDSYRLDADFATKLANRAAENGGVITAEMAKEAELENCKHDARLLAIWAYHLKLLSDPNDYQSLVCLTEEGQKLYDSVESKLSKSNIEKETVKEALAVSKYDARTLAYWGKQMGVWEDANSYATLSTLSEEGKTLYYKLEGAISQLVAVRENVPTNGTNTGYDPATGFVVNAAAGMSGDLSGTKYSLPNGEVLFWKADRCDNFVYPPGVIPPRIIPPGETDEPTPHTEKEDPNDPKKDPKQTKAKGNTNNGKGADTNNGKGSKESAAAPKNGTTKQNNSTEYNNQATEMKGTQQTQKTGSDNNNSSTSTPSGAKTDNNGAKDNKNEAPSQDNPTDGSSTTSEDGDGHFERE